MAVTSYPPKAVGNPLSLWNREENPGECFPWGFRQANSEPVGFWQGMVGGGASQDVGAVGTCQTTLQLNFSEFAVGNKDVCQNNFLHRQVVIEQGGSGFRSSFKT